LRPPTTASKLNCAGWTVWAAQENVIFRGPVGAGKGWFAEALGCSACRARHRVRFVEVTKLLLALRLARADHSSRARAADVARPRARRQGRHHQD
jgi:DNA replication protein DnaC